MSIDSAESSKPLATTNSSLDGGEHGFQTEMTVTRKDAEYLASLRLAAIESWEKWCTEYSEIVDETVLQSGKMEVPEIIQNESPMILVDWSYLHALRKAAGHHIEPDAAEVHWQHGEVLDPYGDYPDVPHICVVRQYFARNPLHEVWINFHDLPDETGQVIWQRHKTNLAFPAGMDFPEIDELREQTPADPSSSDDE